MTKISVIVPVYNNESELAQCLDSIISQSFSNIEIICVNDGSTDSSPEILEKYALFDNRIKIINKKHNGTASARNTGIDASCGEYTAFVDPNDRISPLMFERLYHNAKNRNSDVAYCNIIWYNTAEHKYFAYNNNGVSNFLDQRYKNTGFNENEIPPAIFFEIPCTCNNKIYLSDFIKSKNIRFIDGYAFEDIPFFAQIFLSAQKISFDQNKLYIYRTADRPSIIPNTEKSYNDAFFILNTTRDIFKKNNKWDKYKTLWLLYETKTFLVQLHKIDNNLQEEYFSRIKKHFEKENFNEYDIEFLKNIPLFSYLTKLLEVDFDTFKPYLEKLEEMI